MKTKMRKVYYCEYCRKHSLKNISEHEKHCTANPHRECKLCGAKDISAIIKQYKESYKLVTEINEDKHVGEFQTIDVKWARGKVTLTQIQRDVEFCPNCTLTVLRCSELNKYPQGNDLQFEYKKELQAWWDDANQEESVY